MLLADSEFRHELEAEIEPFKGLLLGLFFVAVGMSTNLGLLADIPWQILGMTVALIGLKAAVLFFVGRISGLPTSAWDGRAAPARTSATGTRSRPTATTTSSSPASAASARSSRAS